MRRRSGRHSRGNTVVEFALGFTLLWGVFAAVFQFGYSVYLYDYLMTAVADGAMLAARDDFKATTNSFTTDVQNMVVYGSIAGGGTPIVPNLTTANVKVSWTSDSAGIPQTITVSIINYTVNAVVGSFTFNNKPSCTVRYAGNFMD